MKQLIILVWVFLSIILLGNVESKGECIDEKIYGLHDKRDNSYTSANTPTIDIPLPLNGVSEQILYRSSYIVSYNKNYKIPNWVAWHLTANHIDGSVKRPGNAWHEDIDVPYPRATIADYKGSGWTRGHMCPAGDNKWDSNAMYETFLFTNCCPQNANLNSGTWNQIEMSCRRWAETYGDIYSMRSNPFSSGT